MRDNTFVYICFRGDSGKGGLLAERVYSILTNKYNIECYFSSASNRIPGGNFREKEVEAFAKATHFFLILTDDVFSYINEEDDEVRFELETALNNNDLQLIALADATFQWKDTHKNKLIETYGKTKAERIIHLDYLQYKGIRAIGDIEEKIKQMLHVRQVLISSSIDELIDTLIKKQLYEIEKTSNSSRLGSLLQLFSNAHYYPPKLTKNGISFNSLADDIFENLSSYNSLSYFVVGEAGCGKTQLLQRTFRELCLGRTPGTDYLPVYISLNTQKSLACSEKTLLSFLLSKYQIPCSSEFASDFSRKIRFICFFDGIDELQSNMNYTDIVKEMESCEQGNIMVFSGRKSFYENLYLPPIQSIIMMNPLEKEDIEVIIAEKYGKASKHNIERLMKMINTLSLHGNMLFLSLIILFYKPDHSIPLDEISVFDTVIRGILIREFEKYEKKSSKESIDKCEIVLMESALILFLSLRKGKDLTLNGLIHMIVERLACKETFVRFVLSVFLSEDVLHGIHFFHKSFEDFFLSKAFVAKICSNDPNEEFLELFSYNFNLETNAFITKLFRKDPYTVFSKLKEIFYLFSEKQYYSKNQVLNHMNRTEQYESIHSFAKKQLLKCFDPTTKIMLLHSLEATGTEKDEEKYYKYVSRSEKRVSLLCGGTLLNYELSAVKKELPYYDDGSKTWYPVFLAYKKHVEQCYSTPHYYRALRINLLTANYYISKRRYIEPEIADYYYSVNDIFQKDKSAFGQKVFAEYKSLIDTIRHYQDTELPWT